MGPTDSSSSISSRRTFWGKLLRSIKGSGRFGAMAGYLVVIYDIRRLMGHLFVGTQSPAAKREAGVLNHS